MKSIELEVKNFIKGNNMTMDQFIDKVGMSAPGWYNMLRTDSMKVTTLQKIAEIMGVDICYFFSDEEKVINNKDIDDVFEILKKLIKANKVH
jgi:transcriptional regulator with XRE-family HTH domain